MIRESEESREQAGAGGSGVELHGEGDAFAGDCVVKPSKFELVLRYRHGIAVPR